jgi:hypothetical protein
MNSPEQMTRIVNGKRYSVKTAALLASNCYWDGSNWERNGRNLFLYRAPNGGYFTVSLTQWQGERDILEPVDLATAITLYENDLPEHDVSYEEAFPGVEVTEA